MSRAGHEREQGDLAPYEAIERRAEIELELACRGEVDSLAALAPSWEQLVDGLSERPPPAAAPLLTRARILHERTRAELLSLRERVLGEISCVTVAKRTAEGYGGQIPRRPSLDRSA